jgi:succinate dehydrogenase subunit C
MSARIEARLWWAQRVTAAVLAFCVAIHLATIIYAVRGGLTAAEVLARTHGNLIWAGFYALFVLAASVHAAIGLRTIAGEWLQWRGPSADGAMALVALGIAALGMRAVAAVAL